MATVRLWDGGCWLKSRLRWDRAARCLVEPAPAAVLDHDDVLDPHAEAIRQVDTGLDAVHHAGGERLATPLREVRRFVDLEPQSVTEPVDEVLKTGGYIPFGDHFIPPEIHFNDFKYYRNRLNEMCDAN